MTTVRLANQQEVAEGVDAANDLLRYLPTITASMNEGTNVLALALVRMITVHADTPEEAREIFEQVSKVMGMNLERMITQIGVGVASCEQDHITYQ